MKTITYILLTSGIFIWVIVKLICNFGINFFLLHQIVLWVAIPSLLEQGSVTLVMTILLIVFLFQYLPKIYHSVCHLRRTQNLSGYIFGTVWWGIALNMIAYFVASHVSCHSFLFNLFIYLYVHSFNLISLKRKKNSRSLSFSCFFQVFMLIKGVVFLEDCQKQNTKIFMDEI